VFVNGVVDDYAALRSWLQPGDYLVCADGGTRHCLALGLMPDVVVGDLDSVDPAELPRLAASGVAVQRHPVDKDQTDLELAIEAALAAGADQVLLLGALGGRLDQTLANLLILAQRPWPAPIRLAEGRQIAQMLRSGETLTLDMPPGSTVSALPLSAQVTGITYAGLKYPLADATLEFGSTRGISNQVIRSPASIRIGAGLLLIVTEAPAVQWR
jgi:thiamine pyrophosphokinase